MYDSSGGWSLVSVFGADCDSADSDDTVVVGGAGAAGDDTVVVDRAVVSSDDTVVVAKKSAPGEAGVLDDATVVVDRAAGGSGSGAAADDATVAVERPRAQIISDDVLRVLPSRRSVRGVRQAPVEPDFGRQAVDAPGAGAVDAYVPRTVVAPPRLPDRSQSDPERVRARPASEVRVGAALPSVERSSARLGVLGVVSCAAACVVSVVGIIVIVAALVR